MPERRQEEGECGPRRRTRTRPLSIGTVFEFGVPFDMQRRHPDASMPRNRRQNSVRFDAGTVGFHFASRPGG